MHHCLCTHSDRGCTHACTLSANVCVCVRAYLFIYFSGIGLCPQQAQTRGRRGGGVGRRRWRSSQSISPARLPHGPADFCTQRGPAGVQPSRSRQRLASCSSLSITDAGGGGATFAGAREGKHKRLGTDGATCYAKGDLLLFIFIFCIYFWLVEVPERRCTICCGTPSPCVDCCGVVSLCLNPNGTSCSVVQPASLFIIIFYINLRAEEQHGKLSSQIFLVSIFHFILIWD